jgi:hypothetical protein
MRDKASSMKKRKPKKSDYSKIDEAFELLCKTIQLNQHIEPSIWASAMWSCIVTGYINSRISYEEFCEEADQVTDHYKKWWDEEK